MGFALGYHGGLDMDMDRLSECPALRYLDIAPARGTNISGYRRIAVTPLVASIVVAELTQHLCGIQMGRGLKCLLLETCKCCRQAARIN